MDQQLRGGKRNCDYWLVSDVDWSSSGIYLLGMCQAANCVENISVTVLLLEAHNLIQ